MFGSAKVKLDRALVARVKRYADIAGYSSVEEFIIKNSKPRSSHVVRNSLYFGRRSMLWVQLLAWVRITTALLCPNRLKVHCVPRWSINPKSPTAAGLSEAWTINGTTESESANSTSRFDRDMEPLPAFRIVMGHYDPRRRNVEAAGKVGYGATAAGETICTASMLRSDSSSLPAGEPVIEKI